MCCRMMTLAAARQLSLVSAVWHRGARCSPYHAHKRCSVQATFPRRQAADGARSERRGSAEQRGLICTVARAAFRRQV